MVADGVEFGDGAEISDGAVVMRWRGQHATTVVHAGIESVEAIHCHGGASEIRWLDPGGGRA